MTKEKAIKLIKSHCYFNSLMPVVREALDMAIKALEQEPCEDAISRSNLLSKLDICYKDKIRVAPNNMAEGFMQVEKLIKQEPLVTPQQKISVEVFDEIRGEIEAIIGEKGMDDYDFCSGLICARNIIDKYKE